MGQIVWLCMLHCISMRLDLGMRDHTHTLTPNEMQPQGPTPCYSSGQRGQEFGGHCFRHICKGVKGVCNPTGQVRKGGTIAKNQGTWKGYYHVQADSNRRLGLRPGAGDLGTEQDSWKMGRADQIRLEEKRGKGLSQPSQAPVHQACQCQEARKVASIHA